MKEKEIEKEEEMKKETGKEIKEPEKNKIIKVLESVYDAFEEFKILPENKDIDNNEAIMKLLETYDNSKNIDLDNKDIIDNKDVTDRNVKIIDEQEESEKEKQRREFEKKTNDFLIQKYTEWCQEFDGRERRKQLKHQHKFRNTFEAWVDFYLSEKIKDDQ